MTACNGCMHSWLCYTLLIYCSLCIEQTRIPESYCTVVAKFAELTRQSLLIQKLYQNLKENSDC